MAFESGVVLEYWSSSVIVPLDKAKGERERTECRNCRIISLLSMAGEIFIYHHLLHPPCQLSSCHEMSNSR